MTPPRALRRPGDRTLTAKSRLEICERYVAGATLKILADEFHVSTFTVRAVLLGEKIQMRPVGRKRIEKNV